MRRRRCTGASSMRAAMCRRCRPGREPLSNFVTAPDALARRLSQIGVVADEESGAIVARTLAQGQRLVSRGGAFWRWDGFTVKAGTPTAAATRLAQRNRLTELEQPRAVATALVRAAQARFGAAVEAGRAAEAQDAAARDAARHAYAEAQGGRTAQAALARDAAAQSARLATLVEQAARLAADLAEHEARHAESEEKFSQIPDPSAAREQLAQDRTALAAERTTLAELQATMHRLAREADARRQRVQTAGPGRNAVERRAPRARDVSSRSSPSAPRAPRRSATSLPAGRRRSPPSAMRCSRSSRTPSRPAERRPMRWQRRRTPRGEAERRLKAIESELGTAREDRVREEATVGQAEQGAARACAAHPRTARLRAGGNAGRRRSRCRGRAAGAARRSRRGSSA